MSPSERELPPLTQEQQQIAEDLVDACELDDVRGRILEFHIPATGEVVSGTVEYGLGRCAEHFARLGLTPEMLAQNIRERLDTQENRT